VLARDRERLAAVRDLLGRGAAGVVADLSDLEQSARHQLSPAGALKRQEKAHETCRCLAVNPQGSSEPRDLQAIWRWR